MNERISPPLGAYHVRATARPAQPGEWLACGQTWMNQPDGSQVLLAEVTAGPHGSEQVALDQAYARAYADTLRLILREFACF